MKHGALLPEQGFPLKIADQLQQRGLGREHHHSTLVKQCQRIPDCATAVTGIIRPYRVMPRIQRRFCPWKHQPHKNIEKIMPVAIAHFQFSAFVNADFVRQFASGGHQLQRTPRGHPHVCVIEQLLQQGSGRPIIAL